MGDTTGHERVDGAIAPDDSETPRIDGRPGLRHGNHDHHLLEEFEELIGGSDGLPIDPDVGPEPDRGAPRVGTAPAPRLVDDPLALVAVFVGGFFGTLARYEFGLAWPEHLREFPATTFVINVSGALLIGLLLTAIVELLLPRRYLRQLLCVGVLGGWTTMSTLAVESVHLLGGGALLTAFAYLASSLAAGTVAAGAGIAAARRFRPASYPVTAPTPSDRRRPRGT